MALEGYALLVPHDAAITYGTPLEHYYTGPDIHFHFPYPLFGWVPMLPRPAMYGLAYLLILSGVAMALGFCYRASARAVFGIWAYFFVVESTRTYWQSHYYLELLVTFLLIWMPAANRWSVDGLLRNRRHTAEPDAKPLAHQSVPFWSIFLLRGQLVIAYFYAGVAKLNADWLVDAAPVRWFLAEPNVLKPYENYLSPELFEAAQRLVTSSSLAYLLCYTGAVFDLGIGFLMLWPRGRLLGMALMLVFHATNHMLIFDDIGWFPFVGMGTATIFLREDWPERTWAKLKRAKPTQPETVPAETSDLNRTISSRVLAFVTLWLLFQSLLPLRQHLIDSDARFTYEGLSYSWRLKSDTRHAISHSLTVQDDAIISRSSRNRAEVNWSAWTGDRNIYRRVQPSRINWPRLPEFAVILEPGVGERIVYNPFSNRAVSHVDSVAVDRIVTFWEQYYGRKPNHIRPLARADAARKLVEEMDQVGEASHLLKQLEASLPGLDRLKVGNVTNDEALGLVRDFRNVSSQLVEVSPNVVRPILRRTYPFLQQGEQYRTAPFFLIEDDELLQLDEHGYSKIAKQNWAHAQETSEPGFNVSPSQQPMLIYYASVGMEARDLLPLAYISDVHLNSKVKPRIRWNSLRDLSPSKLMHTSGQAFYLRRYARRVASYWEDEFGRRPKVFARTSVSYNRRNYQPLVDPRADLASVPAKWFRRNEWILDMESQRIPRDYLNGERPDPLKSVSAP